MRGARALAAFVVACLVLLPCQGALGQEEGRGDRPERSAVRSERPEGPERPRSRRRPGRHRERRVRPHGERARAERPDHAIEELFRRIDRNGDGVIDLDEFRAAAGWFRGRAMSAFGPRRFAPRTRRRPSMPRRFGRWGRWRGAWPPSGSRFGPWGAPPMFWRGPSWGPPSPMWGPPATERRSRPPQYGPGARGHGFRAGSPPEHHPGPGRGVHRGPGQRPGPAPHVEGGPSRRPGGQPHADKGRPGPRGGTIRERIEAFRRRIQEAQRRRAAEQGSEGDREEAEEHAIPQGR